MNVPLHNVIGLNVYRELIGREKSCSAGWEHSYGAVRSLKPWTLLEVRSAPLSG